MQLVMRSSGKLSAAPRARYDRWMRWACLLLVGLLAACAPLNPPLYPTYTPSPSVPAPTPTITPVWFPETDTPTPLPSPTSPPATPDPRPPTGRLIYSDTFQTPSAWSTGQLAGAQAAFGVQEVSLTITGGKASIAAQRPSQGLSDFYAEITANPVFCRGLDEYGLQVRAASAGDYYRLGVSCDGQARVDRVLAYTAQSLITWQYAAGIPLGGPSIARLAVWAKGDSFGFLVNQQLVLTFKDPKLSVGGLGVYARSASSQPVTVNFSDLLVWELVH